MKTLSNEAANGRASMEAVVHCYVLHYKGSDEDSMIQRLVQEMVRLHFLVLASFLMLPLVFWYAFQQVI